MCVQGAGSSKQDAWPYDPETGEKNEPSYEVECAVCGWASDDPASGCATLRLLALPYAGHPDYDEGWRPS